MSPSINDSMVFDPEKFKKNYLQLLLFIDDRHSSQKNIEQIKIYLESLTKDYQFDLEVIEISKHPHLLEHFKLVATPALVKINPLPKHTLAGSDLTTQLQKWWYRWQNDLLTQNENSNNNVSDEKSNSILQTCLPSSELIRLNDEIFRLKQEKKELKKQIEFKDQMLAMLAHDLRSPLTAASLAFDTIEKIKDNCNPEFINSQPSLLKRLYTETKKQFKVMDKMITDLLEVSKSINHDLEISPLELNLVHLCTEILVNLEIKLQQKKLILVKDIPQNLPNVYADLELLRQVIINLLENAIKYTPNDGKITFSIVHRTNQIIQVTISDTGMGIPKEKRELIFNDHFRLKRDKEIEGFGIGLALCHKVIKAHSGEIWVDNNTPQGSRFHFTLPVHK